MRRVEIEVEGYADTIVSAEPGVVDITQGVGHGVVVSYTISEALELIEAIASAVREAM
jgi:hypothetical protein